MLKSKNNKIRLLYFASHFIQYNIGLFRAMSQIKSLDFQVIFEDRAGLKPTYNKDFNQIIVWDNDLINGYKHKIIKNYSMNFLGNFFSRINPSIIPLLIFEKPSYVILHGYTRLSDWILFYTAKLLNIKIIFRGEATLKKIDLIKSWKYKFKNFVISHLLKNCYKVLYSCSGNKQYWKYYKVENEKLLFFPCAVDNEFFQSKSAEYQSKKKEIKNILGIDEDDLVILFLAQFSKHKRPLDLLKAVNIIDNKKITLLFVGDGVEKKNIENFAKRNKIKAKFVGFKNQSEISKYYSVSDLSIVISEYDPSPKAMNEAMNFKLPIIVTDVVGTAYDLVKEGENGFIVKVGDINKISQKIDYVNKNKNIISEMGRKSLDIVNQWTFKKNAETIEKIVDRF